MRITLTYQLRLRPKIELCKNCFRLVGLAYQRPVQVYLKQFASTVGAYNLLIECRPRPMAQTQPIVGPLI